jgi:hypothetical protein
MREHQDWPLVLTLVCALITIGVPFALWSVLRSYPEYKDIPREIKHVIAALYLFLGWIGLGQTIRVVEHFIHGHTPVWISVSLNAMRLILGISVLVTVWHSRREERAKLFAESARDNRKVNGQYREESASARLTRRVSALKKI